jgi:hypothetical protein
LIVERVCSRDTIRRMDRPAAAADVACWTFTPLRHTAVHPHGAGAFVVFVHDPAYYGPPSAVSVQLCTPPRNFAHRHNLLLEADDLRFQPDRRISKPAIQPVLFRQFFRLFPEDEPVLQPARDFPHSSLASIAAPLSFAADGVPGRLVPPVALPTPS